MGRFAMTIRLVLSQEPGGILGKLLTLGTKVMGLIRSLAKFGNTMPMVNAVPPIDDEPMLQIFQLQITDLGCFHNSPFVGC